MKTKTSLPRALSLSLSQCVCVCVCVWSCFHQSGNKPRDSNPSHYRDPEQYEAMFEVGVVSLFHSHTEHLSLSVVRVHGDDLLDVLMSKHLSPLCVCVCAWSSFHQSGNKPLDSNPSHYRDPEQYEAMFEVCVCVCGWVGGKALSFLFR